MIFEAKASNGKVQIKIDEVWKDISDVVILSQGKAESEGIVILEQLEGVYIAIPIGSIQNTLNNIKNVASAVKNICSNTTIASLGVPTMGWATPPTLPTTLQTVAKSIVQIVQSI